METKDVLEYWVRELIKAKPQGINKPLIIEIYGHHKTVIHQHIKDCTITEKTVNLAAEIGKAISPEALSSWGVSSVPPDHLTTTVCLLWNKDEEKIAPWLISKSMKIIEIFYGDNKSIPYPKSDEWHRERVDVKAVLDKAAKDKAT